MTVTDPFQGVPSLLADAMRQRGFTELSSVQSRVIASESAGRDLRISSQTGSGKTAALGLALAPHFLEPAAGKPAKRAGPSALVIAPTRELAVQVATELRWLYGGIRGLAIEVVTGGSSLGRERLQLSKNPGIVVGTPGRILDHHRNRALDCSRVEHVVLDEADRMLDMGFREELESIVEALPKQRQSHLISATFPAGVRRLADRFQKDPLHIEGTQLGAANEDIEHVAHLVRPREVHAALVNLLLLAQDSRCLLFVKRRVDAANIAEKLAADGFSALPISGELAQAQRTRTLDAFKRGTIQILVATDVAARGIDVPDIGTVIHIDAPLDSDTYTHRSGRTGRAGRKGRSIVLVPVSEHRRVKRVLSNTRIDIDWQPVPSPNRVRKALMKRSRRALRQRLDAETPPDEKTRNWAQQLLDEGRDPISVIATLLEAAGSDAPCEPKDLEQVDLKAVAARPPRTSAGFVRFELNWGESKGASPSRVLSHVCRRGGIQGKQVGAIDVGPSTSSFEISVADADEFETRTRKPDRRDPGVRITRCSDAAPNALHRIGPRSKPTGRPAKKPYLRGKTSGGAPKRFKGKPARQNSSK